MQNAADHPTIIDPLFATHIAWQMRFDPRPLLIAQPVQTASHLLCSLARTESLSDPLSNLFIGFQP
jgi:hypothetical protein